jgi:NAD(P)-dependent dehydrogenase (short-subunit alcohol dehydrogenase family)
VVTGASRGIGAAVAAELARLGADVTLMARDEARAREQATFVARAHGVRATAVACDVADADSVAHAFARAHAAHGDAHVLVNNAGQAQGAPFEAMSREVWDRLLAVNLTGAMLCTQAALPAMLAAKDGRVVNVASVAGLKGYRGLAAYCASKHGLVGLTRALALETARTGVTVNAVCPSYADTDMAWAGVDAIAASTGKSREDALQAILKHVPMGRLVRPDEVAAAVGWLCSPAAAAVTGQALAVAGGEV